MKLRIVCVLIMLAALREATAEEFSAAIDIGTRVEMFVDDYLIEPTSVQGAALTLHAPQRREVVLTLDKPWEGQASAYFTVFQDGPRYRMYYRGHTPRDDSESQVTCYAESDDGIEFTRPNLGLHEFNGNKENNIILSGVVSHNFAPFLDANPAAKPVERYKALAGISSKLFAFVSADGIRWKQLRPEPVMTKGTFDSLNLAFWDPTAQRYRAYSRYFDKGGYQGARAIQSTESSDFVNWSEPRANRYAAGVPLEHFYTNATTPCPGAPHHLLSFPKRFVPERTKVAEMREPGVSDAVFMSSRDGLNWDRTFLEAWLRPGLDQRNWTQRSNMPAWGIVQTSPEEFSMYVSEHYDWPDNRMRRLTIRRHGFASMRAGARGGEFTTRPITFAGDRLVLNYATSAAGSVRLEIQDQAGKPLPGFALDDMPELFGDELDAELSWKSGNDLSKIAGSVVRLRFVLRDADVFALGSSKSGAPGAGQSESGAASELLSEAPARTTQANVMVEVGFTAKSPHEDPFNAVSLDAVFTTPSGKQLRVPAFWAGGDRWKVRYASPEVGTHRFQTECSAADDAGLHGVQGQVEVQPYTGENPLYKHGPLRVSENKRYLQHADGRPFFWLGDTWWMGLCHRLQWPEEVKRLAEDRKAKGFNVIQLVAGLYPDMHPFDPRGANEAGFPWEAEYAAVRPEYFDAADERLLYLVDQGFTPCIVGAWGYYMPWMGVEKLNQHWRYLIARYGALPVVWCAAGEANLPWYLAKSFPYDDRGQVKQWTEVLRFIRGADPFRRPLTIHPTGIGRLSARNATDDPALLDFDMLQTPHGQREAVEPTVRTMRESYGDTPRLPVINGEAAYEMLGDKLPTKWTRQMFWLCMTQGACGHTYGANGIWQCNRPGQPHGPSPHHPADGAGYGKIPWNESMNLPGSAQVGYGKALFEKFAWHEFEPHAEWAKYAEGPESYGPFATGIPGKVRIVYVPEPRSVRVLELEAEARYRAAAFDPQSGKTVDLGPISVENDSSWTIRKDATIQLDGRPVKIDAPDDWVLVLERGD